MKNKTNFFLAFYSFRSKFLKKISPKTYPWIRDTRSGIRKNSSQLPDPGGKKAPDPGSATLVICKEIYL
jgi:hypothetical protein